MAPNSVQGYHIWPYSTRLKHLLFNLTSTDMTAASTMVDMEAASTMVDMAAASTMVDIAAASTMVDMAALSTNLVVNGILQPGEPILIVV